VGGRSNSFISHKIKKMVFTVLVNVHVIPNKVQEFIQATLHNASNSIKEPGVLRFDFIQDQQDPTKFMLIEAYTDDKEAPAAHKNTEHYHRWAATVNDWMASPRTNTKWHGVLLPNKS
jgi:autoinducer 2-degrading protein